jgi:hypothetical protein
MPAASALQHLKKPIFTRVFASDDAAAVCS